jgi:hypothetical protein
VSAWAAILDDVGTRGGTPAQVASRLSLPAPLVQAVLDHAQRLGLVAVAGQGCGSGCPTGANRPAACAGCSLALP